MRVGGTAAGQGPSLLDGEPSIAARAAAEGSNLAPSSGAGRAAKDDPTQSKFGDVWKKIQAEYGAKTEKPREVKKTLGKDDFLRIMISQMQHQDPTAPFKAEQMAQQMAQYASVEQLQNINQNVGKLSTQNQPLERLAMANLIGRSVTVDKERFPHTEGNKTPLSYTLPKDAEQVRLSVVSEAGEVVFTKDLGPQKKGPGTAVWDGLKSNTLPAKSGTYTYQIEAKDAQGSAIQLDPRATVRVIGVSFEGKEPILLVGDPMRPDKVPMSSVSKIESDGSSGLIPGAQSLAQASLRPEAEPHEDVLSLHRSRMADRNGIHPADPVLADEPQGEVAKAKPNYFTFVPGEGSKTIDSAQVESALQGGGRGNARAPQEERGFPNGLGGE